ncbi:MAG: SPOR domain-containing protein [bacterium]
MKQTSSHKASSNTAKTRKATSKNTQSKKKQPSIYWIRILLLAVGAGLFFVMAFSLGILYERKDELDNKKLESLFSEQQKKNDNYSFFNSLTKQETNVRTHVRNKKRKHVPTSTSQNENKQQFSIQAFSFRSKKTAENIVDDLKRSGYAAFTTSVTIKDHGLWHRVMIGHYNSYEDAENAQHTIQQIKDKKTIIIKEE